MEDLKERRLQLQRKKARRKNQMMLMVGLLISSLGSFGFFKFYYLPLVNTEFTRKLAIKDNHIASLQKEQTYLKKELTEIEADVKKKEEQKKPRMIFGTTVHNQNTPLTKELETKIKQSNFIGSVLVIQDNQIILEAGYGYADKQTNRLNTPTSEVMIASIQKAYTAVLIMKLIENQQLYMDTPLANFYPDIPNSDQITIRNLLDMTSGLYLNGYDKKGTSEEAALKYALKNLTYETSTKWRYSSVNYMLLAGIIRQLTGDSYQHFFTTEIIDKLELKHTGFYQDFDSRATKTTTWDNKYLPYQTPIAITEANYASELGTGNLFSSAGDLLTFFQSLLDGKLLELDSLATLWTNQSQPYDYTYASGAYHSADTISSHGVFMGHESAIRLSKDGRTGVVTLANFLLPNKGNSKLTDQLDQLVQTANKKKTD